MIERGNDLVVLREPRPAAELLAGAAGGLATGAVLVAAGLHAWYGAYLDAGGTAVLAAIVGAIAWAVGGRAWAPPTTTLRLGGGGEVRRLGRGVAIDAKDLVAVRLGPLHYKAGWGQHAPTELLPDARIDALLAGGRTVALWRGERTSEADRAAAQAAVTGLLPPELPVFSENDDGRPAPVPAEDRPGRLRLAAPSGRQDAATVVMGLVMGPVGACLALALGIAPDRPGSPPGLVLAALPAFFGVLGFLLLATGLRAYRHPAGLLVDGAGQAVTLVAETGADVGIPFAAIEGLELRDAPRPGETADALVLRHAGTETVVWRLARPRTRPDDGRWAAQVAARVLAHLPAGTPFRDLRAPRGAEAAVRRVGS